MILYDVEFKTEKSINYEGFILFYCAVKPQGLCVC